MAPNARDGLEALDNCVHCGFCLPACPTYLATGDENDSPRGRIHLMRAVERGELPFTDPGVIEHLDACLGCRGCEPVCPSGVEYGRGLAATRAHLARANGLSWRARAVLALFAHTWAWRTLFAGARLARGAGLGDRFAGSSRFGFLFGMLAATSPASANNGSARPRNGGPRTIHPPVSGPAETPTVALFRGCAMEGLFGHVHDATRRTLEVNGYRVIEVNGQACCGALHDHAGDRDHARRLARRNLEAFEGRADFVVVNSAGCGALLKDLGHLLDDEAAPRLAASIKDVTELLVAAGPRPGAPLAVTVCYDAPCHLQHAQRVHLQPLQVLGSIPGLDLQILPGSDRCCGSAGVYGLLHPEMARAILDDKVAAIAAASPRPDLVATGNPGCLMQIGAGLRVAGVPIRAVHPVELLDWSYRLAGFYEGG